MPEIQDHEPPTREVRFRNSRLRKVSALTIGIVAALLTLTLYSFGSEAWGGAGQIVAGIVFPGLLGSMSVAGNVHAFNLGIAAVLNGILYSGLAWAALKLVSAILVRFRNL